MNDCCTSSSSQGKRQGSAAVALAKFAVRPGVTFPDWSAVTSPVVRDALQAMVGSDHVLNRWSGYDPITDRVRVALLQLYTEDGQAPTPGALAERTGLNETVVSLQLKDSAGATWSYSTARTLSAPIRSATGIPVTG